MTQSKILDQFMEQQKFYKDAFDLVHRIKKGKLYKLNILADSFKSLPIPLVVTPLTYNTESIRFKVVAGDVGVTSWGGTFSLSSDTPPHAERLDTVTCKFGQLLRDSTIIEEMKPEELPMYVGCNFVHPDFGKYLEAA